MQGPITTVTDKSSLLEMQSNTAPNIFKCQVELLLAVLATGPQKITLSEWLN